MVSAKVELGDIEMLIHSKKLDIHRSQHITLEWVLLKSNISWTALIRNLEDFDTH